MTLSRPKHLKLLAPLAPETSLTHLWLLTKILSTILTLASPPLHLPLSILRKMFLLKTIHPWKLTILILLSFLVLLPLLALLQLAKMPRNSPPPNYPRDQRCVCA